MNLRDRAFDLVRQIPKGKVTSYGDIADALPGRIPARTVGQWMASCPEGVPWWRVVGRDGGLPIARRGPGLAEEQRRRLARERVHWTEDDRVDMARCRWLPP
ncbi:MAG: cysteine methyltransferase [Armatimonadetes bacterium]|nr:cysteine methyltransferase [Armatimonadota bacterium]NOG93327.1 cysteine methyltransferase [Armatimonadota bacterium]